MNLKIWPRILFLQDKRGVYIDEKLNITVIEYLDYHPKFVYENHSPVGITDEIKIYQYHTALQWYLRDSTMVKKYYLDLRINTLKTLL